MQDPQHRRLTRGAHPQHQRGLRLVHGPDERVRVEAPVGQDEHVLRQVAHQLKGLAHLAADRADHRAEQGTRPGLPSAITASSG